MSSQNCYELSEESRKYVCAENISNKIMEKIIIDNSTFENDDFCKSLRVLNAQSNQTNSPLVVSSVEIPKGENWYKKQISLLTSQLESANKKIRELTGETEVHQLVNDCFEPTQEYNDMNFVDFDESEIQSGPIKRQYCWSPEQLCLEEDAAATSSDEPDYNTFFGAHRDYQCQELENLIHFDKTNEGINDIDLEDDIPLRSETVRHYTRRR